MHNFKIVQRIYFKIVQQIAQIDKLHAVLILIMFMVLSNMINPVHSMNVEQCQVPANS